MYTNDVLRLLRSHWVTALQQCGDIREVLCRLLCGYLRTGYRRSTQWQHHDHRKWYMLHTFLAKMHSQWMRTLTNVSRGEFEYHCMSRASQGTCFTSTSVTSSATQSASLVWTGSVFRLSWRLTSCTSWEGLKGATASAFSGSGWEDLLMCVSICL